MTNTEEPRQKPICPSCGQPVKSSALDRVKFIFFTLALGYVGLSMILLMMSVPAELRRNKTNQPVPWDSWMQPLSNELIFKIFVGGGVATGVLLIYWDWFQNTYKSWKRKHEVPMEEREEAYKYKCHSCGRQWN